MKALIEDIRINHDAWIAQKRTSIGSGDIATIVGANPYCTPLRLWAIKTGREKPDDDNDHMWWGRVMEAPIAEVCARKLKVKIEAGNTLYVHETLPWATATPDFFAYEPEKQTDKSIIECKNVSWRMRQNWIDTTPLGPRLQVLWQLGVTGLKRGFVAPLIGGDFESFEEREVEGDDRLFDQIVELADKFLYYVKKDIPPAPTAEDTKLVDKIVGKLEEKTVEVPLERCDAIVEFPLLHAKYQEHNKAALFYEKKLKALKNQIKLAIGNATHAICGNYEVFAKRVVVQPFVNNGHERIDIKVKPLDCEDDDE